MFNSKKFMQKQTKKKKQSTLTYCVFPNLQYSVNRYRNKKLQFKFTIRFDRQVSAKPPDNMMHAR